MEWGREGGEEVYRLWMCICRGQTGATLGTSKSLFVASFMRALFFLYLMALSISFDCPSCSMLVNSSMGRIRNRKSNS